MLGSSISPPSSWDRVRGRVAAGVSRTWRVGKESSSVGQLEEGVGIPREKRRKSRLGNTDPIALDILPYRLYWFLRQREGKEEGRKSEREGRRLRIESNERD